MVFVDTNILVYATIEQSYEKKKQAISLLREFIDNNELRITTLVLQEYVYTLAKLKIESSVILKDIQFYKQFTDTVSKDTFIAATELCSKIHFFKNINDVIHLKYAEQYCNQLITFDTDFKKLKPYTLLPIKILKE